MTRPRIPGISPFFIVDDVTAAIAFHRDKLGFGVTFQTPDEDLFFAVVERDAAMIMLKSVGVGPLPNAERDPGARWDAYVRAADPDALASEFASHGVAARPAKLHELMPPVARYWPPTLHRSRRLRRDR